MKRGYSATSNEVQTRSSRSGVDSDRSLVSSNSIRPGTSRSKWNPFWCYMRFRRKRLLTVEPVLFLYMFALFMNLFVAGQYVFNRFGREKYEVFSNFTGAFNFCITTEELDILGNGTALGNKVEEESSVFGLISSVATGVPSIVAALVYGPLSNRTGLRWILILIASLACVGGIVAVLIVHFNWSIYYLIGVNLFNALGGDLTGMLTATFTYIADIASNKWLTVRLGILEAMVFVAGTVSFASSGVWLRATGCVFVQPMLLYVACNAAIIVYTLLYLPDSLTSRERREKIAKTPHVGFKMLIRGVKIFFISHYSRWRLWFGIVVIACLYLDAFGLANILGLFLLNKPLQWDIGTIGVYLALAQAYRGIALLFVLPILTVCRLPDSLIVMVGVFISASGFLLTGFVATTWEMFARKCSHCHSTSYNMHLQSNIRQASPILIGKSVFLVQKLIGHGMDSCIIMLPKKYEILDYTIRL